MKSPPLFLTTQLLSVSPVAEPTQKPTNEGAVGAGCPGPSAGAEEEPGHPIS